MIIKNNGTTPDRLIGGSVYVADRFQLHSMTMENGVAKMRDLSGIEIKPGQTIELKPGPGNAIGAERVDQAADATWFWGVSFDYQNGRLPLFYGDALPGEGISRILR
jgi:hypothetical protein